MPSGEVTTVPAAPTAQNLLPFQATPFRSLVVFDVLAVQVMPSFEEDIPPPDDTATTTPVIIMRSAI